MQGRAILDEREKNHFYRNLNFWLNFFNELTLLLILSTLATNLSKLGWLSSFSAGISLPALFLILAALESCLTISTLFLFIQKEQKKFSDYFSLFGQILLTVTTIYGSILFSLNPLVAPILLTLVFSIGIVTSLKESITVFRNKEKDKFNKTLIVLNFAANFIGIVAIALTIFFPAAFLISLQPGLIAGLLLTASVLRIFPILNNARTNGLFDVPAVPMQKKAIIKEKEMDKESDNESDEKLDEKSAIEATPAKPNPEIPPPKQNGNEQKAQPAPVSNSMPPSTRHMPFSISFNGPYARWKQEKQQLPPPLLSSLPTSTSPLPWPIPVYNAQHLPNPEIPVARFSESSKSSADIITAHNMNLTLV